MSVVLALHVTPRAARDEIAGVGADGALRVRVAAAPVDGAANKAVVGLLSTVLGVPRSAVAISAGASARRKRIAVAGLGVAEVTGRWPGVSARQG